jgi:hypothetical protein
MRDGMAEEIDLLDPSVWDNISNQMQREFLRQAEMMVKGSVTVALGTDMRAATVMSVFGAGGIALLAAAATLIGTKSEWLLIVAPVIGAIGLLAAAVLCARAIAPVRFLLPGVRPKTMFFGDVTDEKSLSVSLIHSAQRAIDHNMTMIMRSAEWFELSLWVAGAGILGGLGFIALWVASRGAVFS